MKNLSLPATIRNLTYIMKLKLLFITVLLFSFSAISQTDFVSAYFIKTNGLKTDCFIKNEDWRGSPTTFEYKIEENGEVKIGNLDNVIEFGSGDSFKYIKATVEIDQSSDKVSDISDSRNPLMKEETVFLKTLVEGKTSLYYSEKENTPRYFFKLNDGEIEQLVFKRYMVTSTKMGNNELYKQQLATVLNCNKLTESNFENLEYKKNKLITIVSAYNTCQNSETVVYGKMENKAAFNLTIRPGVTFSSLSIQKNNDEQLNFENKSGFRIGLEAEYVLPFNNGKWSIFIEPTYRNYSSEKEYIYVDFLTFQKTTVITATYNSIELPIGGRHYMFLNEQAAFFINAAFLMDASVLDSKIDSSNEGGYDLKVKADASIVLGLGFKYRNKYSVEARYHTPRQLLDYDNINSKYKSFSLIAGYNFL